MGILSWIYPEPEKGVINTQEEDDYSDLNLSGLC
jgi:hypothetical protein